MEQSLDYEVENVNKMLAFLKNNGHLMSTLGTIILRIIEHGIEDFLTSVNCSKRMKKV